MKRFHRRRGQLTTRLSPAEVDLLDSLLGQLIELLDTEDTATEPEPPVDEDDPFSLWARDLQAEPDQPEEPDDPVLQRLFPNAYPHDDQASSDFRRFTARDMTTAKLSAAGTVRRALGQTRRGDRPLIVADADVDDWLKTLTTLRLSLATRLGIDDAESAERMARLSEDDPRAFVMSVYDWLGFAQETLVEAL